MTRPTFEFVSFVHKRTGERVKNSLRSLRAQVNAPPFDVTIVEIGARSAACVQSNSKICAEFGARHVVIDSDSPLWNKSMALNYAIRRSDADYIATFDIDMIFSGNMMMEVERQLAVNPNTFFLAQVYDLPRKADFNKIGIYARPQYLHPEIGVGGIQIGQRSVFHLLSGYDEQMWCWGGMDVDFAVRLNDTAVEKVRLNDLGVFAYHQWHSRGDKQRAPYAGLWLKNNEAIGKSMIKNGPDWGILTEEVICQRPQNEKPDISIVVGTWNRLANLQECVESIRLAVGHATYEIIVVDAGSDDGTLQWCYAQSDVVLIEQGRKVGAIRAFNRGFTQCRADYVAHLNDDVVVEPGALYKALKYLRKHRQTVGQVALAFREPGTDGQYIHKDMFGRVYANFSLTQRWLGDLCGWWGDKSYTYGGDTRLSMVIWLMGYKVIPLEDCRLYHYKLEDELRIPNKECPFFVQRWLPITENFHLTGEPMLVPERPLVKCIL